MQNIESKAFSLAVRKIDSSEVGRLRIRADAKKRYELYKYEWVKIDRLTRPLHQQQALQQHTIPGSPGSPSELAPFARQIGRMFRSTNV